MKPEEAIEQLRIDMDLCRFNPSTGEVGFTNEMNEKTYNADELAISALEKQIPKKPIVVDDELEPIMHIWECPACGRQRMDGRKARGSYCQECGQAIDWSVVEE